MKKKLTGRGLQNYLWEALQDYRDGKMTTNELSALSNTAEKIIRIAALDIMSDNSIGSSKKELE